MSTLKNCGHSKQLLLGDKFIEYCIYILISLIIAIPPMLFAVYLFNWSIFHSAILIPYYSLSPLVMIIVALLLGLVFVIYYLSGKSKKVNE